MPVYIFFKTLTCRLFDRGHGGQRKHRTGRAIFYGETMDSFNDVFQEVLKYCRNCKSISEPGYNKWIKILEPMKLENNVAYLLTDSDFSRDITMNAYENLLKEAFLNTLGFEVDIKILVKDKEEVNETEEKDIEVKVADFSDEEIE